MARLIQTDLGDVCEPNESNSDSETNNSAGVETIKKAIYSVFLQLLLSQTKLTGKSFLLKKKKSNYRVWQLQIWLYGLALFLGAHFTQVQQFDAGSATSVCCICSSPYSATYRIGVCPKSMKALRLPPQLRYFTSWCVYYSVTVNQSFIFFIKNNKCTVSLPLLTIPLCFWWPPEDLQWPPCQP